MVASRLVKLIEEHSDQLAAGLIERVHNSSRTVAYFKLPPEDLHHGAYEIYHHLGEWLTTKTETDVEYRFTELGMLRAQQGIPIADFVWAMIITKENLWHFLGMQMRLDHIVEVLGELELFQIIDQFFDRALYYAMVGYARAERMAKAA